ncbi:MAG: DUF2789 family protein, partial [Cupriavidus necator]
MRRALPLCQRSCVMDTSHHDLNGLFSQLGLAGEPQAIDAFVAAHR